SLFGNKVINNVFMMDKYAYLACGFGIVVLDMEKEEIKESYNMDPMGNAINVRDITMDNLYIYAATDNGIYQALRTDNLAIYTSWKKMTGLPNGIYNAMASVNGKLYANLSKAIMLNTYNQDEIYVFENGSWSLFSKMPSFGFDGKALKNCYNKLLITTASLVLLYDDVQDKMLVTNSVNGNGNLNSCESEMDNEKNIWIADQNFGLIKNMYFNGSETFYPSGPASPDVNAMCIGGDDALWVVPGGLTAANGNTNTRDGVSIFADNEWTVLKGKQNNINFDTIYDIVNVIVDPVNPKRAYASSFSSGVIEFYDKKPAKIHDFSNSTLLPIIPGNNKYVWTYGMAFDKDNNLWVGNSGVETPLAVKQTNGVWKSLNFTTILGKPYVFQLLIDKNNQKWFVIPGGGGVAVYKGGVNDVPNSSNTKLMTVAAGSGNLASPAVFCLAEDNDGEIWVGTDKGVCVFYNPESIFTGQNFDAQTIKLEQDGNIQLLLATETVQAIAVDAGNRKWFGTSSSGVYLMSEDGTKLIHHFDSKNSPLFSNNVKSIAIDSKTGDVFFGTSKGIISYRSDAIEGQENFTDVYSYPNPVKDNYTGPIVIKGLVSNTIVKITNISGTLVSELTSKGGQAIWDAKNFKGERVGTGVYMVFCTNQDGSQKLATKIVVIN
ncbi:MAG TPA: two-component regulator propeller domain-containing protein, partial [Bacteroidia bacterium]|nr:two-component regulator propeller domain-containing protein [Bacteroidia bacterium]